MCCSLFNATICYTFAEDFKEMKGKQDIREILKERILVLDGAMGSLIQTYKLSEEDYRGGGF